MQFKHTRQYYTRLSAVEDLLLKHPHDQGLRQERRRLVMIINKEK